VLKALTLDEELAEAHASLASLAYRWDWDFAAAEREFRRAIELNPSAASVRHSHALFLALQGRFDDALVEMTQASELDPLSLLISAGIGRVLDLARRPSDAIAQYQRTIDVDPSFAEVYFDLSIALRHVGRFGEALEAARRAMALAPAKPAYRGNLAGSYVQTGHRHERNEKSTSLWRLRNGPTSRRSHTRRCRAPRAAASRHRPVVPRESPLRVASGCCRTRRPSRARATACCDLPR
jgi:Flp pilus assembly protein TadD